MDPYQPLKPSQIDRAYFLITHRDRIMKIVRIALIIFVLAIIAWLGYNIVTLASQGSYNQTAASIMPPSGWETYHQTRQPVDPKFADTTWLSIGNSRYNLVATMVNPNKDWAIQKIDYHFVVNGEALAMESAFANPDQTRLLMHTAYQTTFPLNSVKVEVDNISWRRFENDTPVINWSVSNAKYNPVRNVETSGGSTTLPASVTWDAQNLSLYNFWGVEFQVAIYSGTKLVGINSIVAKDFNSLETRSLETVWLYNLPRVNDVKIIPLVNWLDETNFKDLDI